MPSTAATASRAYAKVILLGEHAVVYSIPALALGLFAGASASAVPGPVPTLTLGNRKFYPEDGNQESVAYAALCQHLTGRAHAVEASLHIPSGVGLGASAALGVAIARAIAQSDPLLSRDATLLRAADAWEQVFHGNPSGIDTRAALFGGCLKFTRGGSALSIPVATRGKLVVGVAAPAASTKLMVERVASFRSAHPARFEAILLQISALVSAAESALDAGDLAALGQHMHSNQALLRELGASTPALDDACRLALQAGAHGAKLTGAGGGGCVIAVAEPDRATEVERTWQSRGISTYLAELCSLSE